MGSNPKRTLMYKQRKLNITTLLLVLGFSLSIGYHYWQGSYMAAPYPNSTPLFKPEDQYNAGTPLEITARHIFGDLYAPWTQAAEGHPYQPSAKVPYASNYFPFAHALLLPFTLFSYSATVLIYLLTFF